MSKLGLSPNRVIGTFLAKPQPLPKLIVMQYHTDSPKRSKYPFTAILILLVHLGLGYMIYQQVMPNGGTDQQTIQHQEAPAIP